MTPTGSAPVLDDDTLRWRRPDQSLSWVFVSGCASQQVLGPFARNIIGARWAGSLITTELGRVVEPSHSTGARPADVRE